MSEILMCQGAEISSHPIASYVTGIFATDCRATSPSQEVCLYVINSCFLSWYVHKILLSSELVSSFNLCSCQRLLRKEIWE